VKEGHSARSIAERLNIGVETVRTHVVHARKKLDARTRAEAVARALETGQIT
jgi:DNA-binding CsgD family transcriptional regulator